MTANLCEINCDNWWKHSKIGCDADCITLWVDKNLWDAHMYFLLVEKTLNKQITKKEAGTGELKKQTSGIIV